MKRKPDAMVTMMLLFFLGLVVTGFSSLSVGSDQTEFVEQDKRSGYTEFLTGTPR